MERKHILEFQYGLSGVPTVVSRTADILVKMFGLAEDWGWCPPRRNPCRFVRRYKVEKHHERFLTPEELYRLGVREPLSPPFGSLTRYSGMPSRPER